MPVPGSPLEPPPVPGSVEAAGALGPAIEDGGLVDGAAAALQPARIRAAARSAGSAGGSSWRREGIGMAGQTATGEVRFQSWIARPEIRGADICPVIDRPFAGSRESRLVRMVGTRRTVASAKDLTQ
jgi:hypothetical protein